MNCGPGYFVKPTSSARFMTFLLFPLAKINVYFKLIQNDLMEEIKDNGPVQIAFKVHDDFFMYKSGIYSKHPNARVYDVENPYHSVKVLGWGSENGVDYWVRNFQ